MIRGKKIVYEALYWVRRGNLLLLIALCCLQNLICKKQNSIFISVARIGSRYLLFCLPNALYFDKYPWKGAQWFPSGGE